MAEVWTPVLPQELWSLCPLGTAWEDHVRNAMIGLGTSSLAKQFVLSSVKLLNISECFGHIAAIAAPGSSVAPWAAAPTTSLPKRWWICRCLVRPCPWWPLKRCISCHACPNSEFAQGDVLKLFCSTVNICEHFFLRPFQLANRRNLLWNKLSETKQRVFFLKPGINCVVCSWVFELAGQASPGACFPRWQEI